ncbi:EamA family transporter RarD [Aurantimonas sp. Leaf443]|uniref:EamA family transporter RarD n=1 Tax=Aurantimonas sp. Leaf443 TaxID=1736378 RepID=UPI0006FCB094|nr:EamA family transporter RarD [Aurantimonas sp. Leaf443]KQT88298.1 permease [Aurantimonas sp. Leaf443]
MPIAESDARRGFAYALVAFLIWGIVFPIYMKTLDHVSPMEIVAHRVLWAIPVAMAILWWQGLLAGMARHFADPRTLGLATLAATLITVNWGVYVYAIVSGQALESALGYYINPLVNIALGAIVLRERPNALQWAAIGLALLGVLALTLQTGGLPWISLVLPLSFGTYGLLRKLVPLGATQGFFMEVAILALPAAACLAFVPGTGAFLADPGETWLLVGSGPLTAVPLILFAAGARLLRYSTIGIMQYIVPTGIAATAIFVFGQPLTGAQAVAFAFILAALALYTVALVRADRAATRARRLDEAAPLA